MNMTENEIRERLSRGEDSHCEFREIVFYGDEPKEPRRAHLADEIAAFANAQGGLLCCGVTDAGDVQGMSPEQMSRLQRMIVDVCTDSIKPPVWPTTGVHLLGGKGLVIVHVPRRHLARESRRTLPPGRRIQEENKCRRATHPHPKERPSQVSLV